MGLLDDGESWLVSMFDSKESVSLTVIPSSGNEIEVVGTIGLASNEVDDDAYTRNSTRYREIIITASQLTDLGTRFHPEEGTIIKEVRDGVTYTYEATASAGRGAWSWHGSTYKAYRIHAMLVDEQSS